MSSKFRPLLCKHRASRQAVVTINGRDFYLGLHGTKTSRLEYDRVITEWLASGRSDWFGLESVEYMIVDLIADYLNFDRSYYGNGPNSELHRMVRMVRPLKRLYGRTLARKFGRLQFKAVRQNLPQQQLAGPSKIRASGPIR